MLPQVINHTVSSCRNFRHLGSLISRHIKNLDSACRDFYFMIVEMPVPLNGRELSREVFRYEILDRNQFGLGVSRIEQQTLKNLVGNTLAVVMERSAWGTVGHHMWRLHMNVESFDRGLWFPAYGFLGNDSATSNCGNRGNN